MEALAAATPLILLPLEETDTSLAAVEDLRAPAGQLMGLARRATFLFAGDM